MSKLSEAKAIILEEIKAKEFVIDAQFDDTIGENGYDEKPLGWKFFRLDIFHRNENGEATFSGKGVYIKSSTGEFFLHSGGVQIKSLSTNDVISDVSTPSP